MSIFKIVSDFSPKGDQPKAIDQLSEQIASDRKHHVLLGVTGSGKTFTMANIIKEVERPTLVIAPNKTLAAQLYSEFKDLFPENAVEYFVSYYDYYQPEAYLPVSDTYIQKDSSINEMIDKMRHSATRSVLSRRDVIVVASVSCIFGLGAPEDYLAMRLDMDSLTDLDREKLLKTLVDMHYERNDYDFHRGVFRIRGDRVEIFPAYEEKTAVRIDFFGDTIESISEIDPLTGELIKPLQRVEIFPASHYVAQKAILQRAVKSIIEELKDQIACFRNENKLIEAQRIEERCHFDLEMMQEIGYCNGIENYSRHFTARQPGEPPPTLLDYFPDDYLMFIDESHITIPQLNGMYKGDRSRKETLVRYGFRLPSALDNRPLKFEEFEKRINQVVYVSATPAEFEMNKGKAGVAEQIVRPTGLLDPKLEVRQAKTQVDDLFDEIRMRIEAEERVLVTTLTKRMAEDLTDYYTDLGLKVNYLHADIKTLERMDIIKDLREGKFDVLVGINLLREGLDIPEVSLVAILDADKEGFLRSTRSLIQTCGRASRHVNGKVIMYADGVTKSMNETIRETNRRRTLQQAYNQKYHIIPTSAHKKINVVFHHHDQTKPHESDKISEAVAQYEAGGKQFSGDMDDVVVQLTKEMEQAANDLDFERAAELRDQIAALNRLRLF